MGRKRKIVEKYVKENNLNKFVEFKGEILWKKKNRILSKN